MLLETLQNQDTVFKDKPISLNTGLTLKAFLLMNLNCKPILFHKIKNSCKNRSSFRMIAVFN